MHGEVACDGVRMWRVREVKRPQLTAELAGVAAASRLDVPRWLFASRDGQLTGVDVVTGETFFSARTPFSLELTNGQQRGVSAVLTASDDGRFVAVGQRAGLEAAVFDTVTGEQVLAFQRGDYHAEHSSFPLRFLDERRLVRAADWNRLEVVDVVTRSVVSPPAEEWAVDYFFGSLERSPGGTVLGSAGWAWHPIGFIAVLDVEPWLRDGVTEPKPRLAVDSEVWDLPLCFLDEERFVTMAANRENDVRLVVARAGDESPLHEQAWPFASELALRGDEVLVLGDELQAFTHELKATESVAVSTTAWHAGTQEALAFESSGAVQLVGRPRPQAMPAEVRALAKAAQDNPSVQARLVLADALESVGLAPSAVTHLRSAGPHDASRCFVVDDLAAD